MKFTKYLLALLVAVCGQATWAQTLYSVDLVPLDGPGAVGILGFGRGGTDSTAPDAASRSASLASTTSERVTFFDRWFVQVDPAVSPGSYAFDGFTIDASGSVLFSVVTFNSYDASGPPVLDTVLFDINATATQAIGTGIFTVRSTCPVSSCIYIDVHGTQVLGDPANGYNGLMVASVVPEPAGWALLAMGLAVVGSVVRRRART